MKNNGYKYKLIVYAGGEYVTDEYEYPVTNLKEAAKKAEELRQEYDNGDYCDVRIDCLPYKDDIHHPSGDYRVWQRNFPYYSPLVQKRGPKAAASGPGLIMTNSLRGV